MHTILKNVFSVLIAVTFFGFLGLKSNAAEDGPPDSLMHKAEQGNAKAQFRLGYEYTSTDAKKWYRLAAIQGHEEGLEEAINSYFMRNDDLITANPQKALQIYKKAKKANPDIDYSENNLEALKICAELEPFNAEAFLKKHRLEGAYQKDKDSVREPTFFVWKLAEDATNTNRFRKPDPELVLNLICRGGWSLASKEKAVRDVYKKWKDQSKSIGFNLCHYVRGDSAISFCKNRRFAKLDKARKTMLRVMVRTRNMRKIALNGYDKASDYFKAKASREAIHGGTGRWVWVQESISGMKTEFIAKVDKARSGVGPKSEYSLQEADKKLKNVYQKLIKALKETPIESSSMVGNVTHKDVQNVQEKWRAYRDATANLLNQNQYLGAYKAYTKDNIKAALTQQRINELRDIMKFLNKDR